MVEQENLDVRAGRIEGKLDALAVSIDERFNQVTDALVEQRQYTEFAFGRLDARLSRVERQIGEEIVPAIARLEGGVGRIERKLDGFIEVQTKTNELVERRLDRLERRDAR